MIVSISQPAYLPWLGYFDRINLSDVHVVLDHVQFEKRSFTSRNQVATNNGPLWLSVPVKTKGQYQKATIDKLEIDNTVNWQSTHWKTIKQVYGKAPYFEKYEPLILPLYEAEWTTLNALCEVSTQKFLEILGIETKLVASSDLKSRTTKSDLILDLARECRADTYISGPFGRDYLNEENFQNAKISILFHDYKHPTYQQSHLNHDKKLAKPFYPYMSILDLIFNTGDDALDVITSDNSLNSSWQK